MLLPRAVTPSTRPPSVTTWPSRSGGAGVKDFHVGHFGRFVEAADRLAALVLAGIAFAGHHDAHRRPRIPLGRRDLVEPAVDGRFQQIDADRS